MGQGTGRIALRVQTAPCLGEFKSEVSHREPL